MDLGLKKKRVLVTGAHRGTGAGIARGFAAEGATVLVHGPKRGDCEPTVGGIQAEGGDAVGVAGDLFSDAGAAALCGSVLEQGPVDVLVNNYGVAEGQGWEASDTDDWVTSYDRNVLSAVRMSAGLKDAMCRRGWGRIVFLGTVGSLRPGPVTPHYYAAKTALGSVAVSLAKDLAGSGVTSNLISPGVIRTAEVEAYFCSKARRKGWGDTWEEIEPHAVASFLPNPLKRFATVEEVASAVVYVASAVAGYINGANIRVDGGAADCVT